MCLGDLADFLSVILGDLCEFSLPMVDMGQQTNWASPDEKLVALAKAEIVSCLVTPFCRLLLGGRVRVNDVGARKDRLERQNLLHPFVATAMVVDRFGSNVYLMSGAHHVMNLQIGNLYSFSVQYFLLTPSHSLSLISGICNVSHSVS